MTEGISRIPGIAGFGFDREDSGATLTIAGIPLEPGVVGFGFDLADEIDGFEGSGLDDDAGIV